MKIVRILSPEHIRHVCIKENWYTGGTVTEYGKLMDRVYDSDHNLLDIDLNKLIEIAEDIYEHSSIDEEEFGSKEDTTHYIINRLLEVCIHAVSDEE